MKLGLSIAAIVATTAFAVPVFAGGGYSCDWSCDYDKKNKSYDKKEKMVSTPMPAASPSHSSSTIVDIAANGEVFNTLVAAVKAADLVEALQGEGPFTVLAPTDKAFAKLPAGTIEHLLKPENKAELVKILTYHVVPAKVTDKEAINANKAKTLQGNKIKFTLDNGQMMVNDAKVIKTNISASNGMVHVIDTVLLPTAKEDKMSKDIVDIAAGGEVFNTLVAAVKAADLVDALKGEGPFTVLAPTDKAFAALPAGTVENLLKPENKDQLIQVLTYHVVPAKVTDVQALNAYKAKTLQGDKVKFRLNDGRMMVNNANIIKTNIAASNGMIHVIDAVLLPGYKSASKK